MRGDGIQKEIVEETNYDNDADRICFFFSLLYFSILCIESTILNSLEGSSLSTCRELGEEGDLGTQYVHKEAFIGRIYGTVKRNKLTSKWKFISFNYLVSSYSCPYLFSSSNV